MPIYVYKCQSCGANIEKMQSVTSDPLVECPECHRLTLKKMLTPAGIIFKGSGWYITDSRKSSSASTPPGNSSESKSSDDKPSDSKSSDNKSSDNKPSESKSSEKTTSAPKAESKSESKSSEPA